MADISIHRVTKATTVRKTSNGSSWVVLRIVNSHGDEEVTDELTLWAARGSEYVEILPACNECDATGVWLSGRGTCACCDPVNAPEPEPDTSVDDCMEALGYPTPSDRTPEGTADPEVARQISQALSDGVERL